MQVPNFVGRLIMIMVIPTYEVSADESHPQPTGAFSGTLAFYIDAHLLAKKFTQNITSGKSGYAWIMDSQGTFLNHPERTFIGQNAFTVRKERMPAISFDAINEIQRQKMLTGQEGWGEYTSGWHKGLAGEIKKLMAYAPVRLLSSDIVSPEKNPYFWSVAVVAPASEVEGAIHSVYQRQFFLQMIIGVFVLFGSIFLLNYRYERQFTVSLEDEVQRQKKELQKSEERYKALVENAADLIYTVDLEGRILSINRYAAKLFARRRSITAQAAGELDGDREIHPEDFIGLTLSDVMADRSAAFHLEWMQEIRKTGKILSKRHPITIGDREFWFSTSIVGLKDEQGQIYAYEIISRDITARKTMEDQLINMEKLASVGTLAAGVAHEINNPIAVILGFNEILLEQTADMPDIHETLKIIEEEGLKCKKIVENLLTFARTPERTETSTDISEALGKMVIVVKNTLLTNKIRLESDIPPNLPRVQGDPQELQQVFINLINNAAGAMKGGGILQDKDPFNCRRTTDCHRNRRYRQRHSQKRPAENFRSFFYHQKGGRGHRLGPVHVLRHHQEIWGGHQFCKLSGGGISGKARHHLYGAASCGQSAEERQPPVAATSETNKSGLMGWQLAPEPLRLVPHCYPYQEEKNMPERILAVDDEPNMLRLLKAILSSKTNYEVVTTNNPLEAAKLLKEEPFDLLITDLKMPLLDGMDLIETVKKIDPSSPHRDGYCLWHD